MMVYILRICVIIYNTFLGLVLTVYYESNGCFFTGLTSCIIDGVSKCFENTFFRGVQNKKKKKKMPARARSYLCAK